jgi:DNA-directed RNA polymerase specialized sigma24 family protein
VSLDLASLRPLVEIIAAERTRSRPDLFEDAVQEGLVAAWQATEGRDLADPRVYATAAARRRISGFLSGRSAFGAPSRQGRRDAQDEVVAPLVTEDGTFVHEPADPAAPAALEAVEVVPAVRAAVARLEPGDRLLVFRRFWLDEVPTKAEHNRWRVVRDRLAADLGAAA